MIVYLTFVFFSVFNAGAMTTLQLQHYALYPLVGHHAFAKYIAANNRAATIPAVIPGSLGLILSIAVAMRPPSFIRHGEALVLVALNVLAFISTFLWQRPLQSAMAQNGYDESATRRLVATNWIRTGALLVNAVIVVVLLYR